MSQWRVNERLTMERELRAGAQGARSLPGRRMI